MRATATRFLTSVACVALALGCKKNPDPFPPLDVARLESRAQLVDSLKYLVGSSSAGTSTASILDCDGGSGQSRSSSTAHA